MTTMTKEQMNKLMVQAEEIMKQIEAGKSVRDIMAELYMKNMEDKTLQQGQVVADAMLESIQNFDQTYAEAKEDLKGLFKKVRKQVEKGKSCEERCNYWLKLAASISAAEALMNDESLNKEDLLKQIDEMQISKEEATEDKEAELREKAYEALENNSLLIHGLTHNAEALTILTNEDQAVELLIDMGRHDLEYRGIIAMLAYTGIKTGQYEEFPVEMTAAQTAVMTCTAIEEIRIMDAVGKGKMAMSVAVTLLSILGAVAIVLTTVVLAGIVTVFTLPFTVVGLFFPLWLVTIVGLVMLTMQACKAWKKVSGKIVKTAVAFGKNVFDGIIAIANYVKENVLPFVIDKAKTIWANLHNHDKKQQTKEKEEMVAIGA